MANTVPQHTHQVDTGLVVTNLPIPLPVSYSIPDPLPVSIDLADPLPVEIVVGAPTYGQVTVTGSATAIGTARAGRTGLTIYNPIASSGPVYLGGAGVTIGTGDILEPSEHVTYSAPTAWFGITGGASIVVSYEDE